MQNPPQKQYHSMIEKSKIIENFSFTSIAAVHRTLVIFHVYKLLKTGANVYTTDKCIVISLPSSCFSQKHPFFLRKLSQK